MTNLMAYYRERRDLFLRGKKCSVYPREIAEQIHHMRGRAGTLLIDERFWLPVCQSAHEFVGQQPSIAREEGLLCARGDWNKAPDDAETKRLKELMRELTR